MTIFERLKNWWLGTGNAAAQPAPDSAESVIVITKTNQPTPAACGCGRSDTGLCVGLHLLSDAEWAISDKNPNRVEVAPVVVTADSPATPVAETAEAPVAKKPRAIKAKAAAEPAEKPKKPRAKKAK